MKRIEAGDTAPDFTLPDHKGNFFTLSEMVQSQNVLLVFNIGFA